MKTFEAGNFDVAVIGAGHAGCEAALACARLGLKTVIFVMNADRIANLACNPSIGGTAKGHLVREIDALGGQMAKTADETLIQTKMLNTSKGPAVYSLRSQIDRRRYQASMKYKLENQENLHLKQSEIVEIRFCNRRVQAVVTHFGALYSCKAAIVCTGTYLRSRVIVGETTYEAGPDGEFAATRLSACLLENGLKLLRFKTGTPARVNKRSIDFSKVTVQPGDDHPIPFSFETKMSAFDQVPCWLTYTNEKTHDVIKQNLHRSPLFSGVIMGTGPRYCPSIEDKVVKFPNRDRHQVFIEPTGADTHEMYLSGLSSSLPYDVQMKMLKTVEGLSQVMEHRCGYAIEYDCFDPTQLELTLEFKTFEGLYSAGQSNGSSGYEEAAAQGLLAGINCVRKLREQSPLILDRSQAYIGVLIDDLVTKGTKEPYRMMTSRAEYRLLLRQDNADMRLTDIGKRIGLIDEVRFARFTQKKEKIEQEIKRIQKTVISPTDRVNRFLLEHNSATISTGISLDALVKRPELDYFLLEALDETRPDLPLEVKEQVSIQVKYEGYIAKQKQQVEQFKKIENKHLPSDLQYEKVDGLRTEAIQKLEQIKPISLGQASRISGVTPADISVLQIHLEMIKRNRKQIKKTHE